ncbi:MAG: hypothetical protein H8E15_08605 [Planctomycetes bacterium]|nr:hypothetical protein [Planctomycetota bacterium]
MVGWLHRLGWMIGGLALTSALAATTPQQSAQEVLALVQDRFRAEFTQAQALPSQWRTASRLPWTPLWGNDCAAWPLVEEVRWLPHEADDSAAKAILLRRDHIDFVLGLGVKNQLLYLQVLADPVRQIGAAKVVLDAKLSLSSQLPDGFFSEPPSPQSKPSDPGLLVAIPADLPPKQRYHALLEDFRILNALQFDATAVIKLVQENKAEELGRIRMQLRFARPAFGSLDMKGWVGAPPRQVHSQILGTADGMVFIDPIRKHSTYGGDISKLVDGMLGFAPLAAWAGLEIAPPLQVQAMDVLGKSSGWTGLAVETLHVNTVYRFDPYNRLVGAAVVRKDGGPKQQIMEYRFHSLELRQVEEPQEYQATLPKQLELIQRSTVKEVGMLQIGDAVPECDLDCRNALIFCWLADGIQSAKDLDQLDRLWRQVQRKNPQLKLIKVPASKSELMSLLQVRYYPSFYVVDGAGDVTERLVGWNNERILRAVPRSK